MKLKKIKAALYCIDQLQVNLELLRMPVSSGNKRANKLTRKGSSTKFTGPEPAFGITK